MWKHSEGVEHVTGGKMSTVIAFLLQFLLGVIGTMVIQNEFNKIGEDASGVANEPQSQPAATPTEPAQPLQPVAAQAQTPPTEPPVPPAPTIPTI